MRYTLQTFRFALRQVLWCLVLVFVGCTRGNEVHIGGGSSSSRSRVLQLMALPSSPTSASGSSSKAVELRVIPIYIAKGAFTPNRFQMVKNERIQLAVTAMSGAYGFAIPKLKIHERVGTGKTVPIDVSTELTGTYQVICTFGCGTGENILRGVLVIK